MLAVDLDPFRIIPITNCLLSLFVIFFETFYIFYEALIGGYDKPDIQEIIISKITIIHEIKMFLLFDMYYSIIYSCFLLFNMYLSLYFCYSIGINKMYLYIC